MLTLCKGSRTALLTYIRVAISLSVDRGRIGVKICVRGHGSPITCELSTIAFFPHMIRDLFESVFR